MSAMTKDELVRAMLPELNKAFGFGDTIVIEAAQKRDGTYSVYRTIHKVDGRKEMYELAHGLTKEVAETMAKLGNELGERAMKVILDFIAGLRAQLVVRKLDGMYSVYRLVEGEPTELLASGLTKEAAEAMVKLGNEL